MEKEEFLKKYPLMALRAMTGTSWLWRSLEEASLQLVGEIPEEVFLQVLENLENLKAGQIALARFESEREVIITGEDGLKSFLHHPLVVFECTAAKVGRAYRVVWRRPSRRRRSII